MSNDTKAVSSVVLRDNILSQIKHAELYKTFREILTKKYKEKEQSFFNELWIAFSFKGQKGYWNKNVNGAIPVQKVYRKIEPSYFELNSFVMSEKVVVKLFDSKSKCPSDIVQGIKSSVSLNNEHWIGYNGGSFCIETERYANWNDDDSVPVGIVNISSADFKKSVLSGKYDIPNDNVMKQAVSLLKERNISEISENEIDKLISIFDIDRGKITKEVHDKVMNNFVMTPEIAEFYIQSLLECDRRRADLEKYDRKCLEEVNSGHWELWSDGEPVAEKGQVIAELQKPLRT